MKVTPIRKKTLRIAAVTTLLLGAAIVAAPQVDAWGSFSTWKSPGQVSTCYATNEEGDEIHGMSSVSTNALQTLVATDGDDGCGLRTEAVGRDSASVVFSQKARTNSYIGGNSSWTASVTTPRNIAKHRCRVEMEPGVTACLLPLN